jgi:iron complex outermembrane receptor protein
MGAKIQARPAQSGRAARHILNTTISAIALLSFGAAVLPPQAAAQQPPASSGASVQRFALDIPAQDLNSALLALASRAGVQIGYDSTRVQGLRSTAVSGTLTLHEALAQMLAGTGYTYSTVSPTRVALVEAPRGSGAAVLPPLTAQGEAAVPSTGTIGNLPPEYVGGQVARGGRIGALGNRDIFETPYSVVPLTRQIIDNQQARVATDVLRNDPTISIFQNANPAGTDDVWSMRGFLNASSQSAFDGLFGLNFRNPPLEQIERVEIFKGTNAMLSGNPGALTVGGMVNFVPKRATDTPVTSLTTRYVSDSIFGSHLDVGRRYGTDGAFGVRVNGSLREGDSAIDDVRKRNDVAAAAFDFRGENVRITLDADYGFNDTRNPLGGTTVAAGSPVPSAPKNTNFWGGKGTRLYQEKDRFVSRVEWDFAENWTATLAGGQLRVSENYNFCGAQITSAAGAVSLDCYQGAGETLNRVGEVAMRGNVTTGDISHKIAFGTALMDQDFRSRFLDLADSTSNIYNPTGGQLPVFPGVTAAHTTNKTLNNSLFVNEEAGFFNDRLLLSAGARYVKIDITNYSETTGLQTSSSGGDAVTPGFGALYKITDKLSVYGNYVEALEDGGVAPNSASNRGQGVSPIASKQVEAGVKADFGSLATTLAVFEITRESAYTDSTTNVYGVYGEQINRGVELSVFGTPTDGVRLLAGVAYLNAETTKTSGGQYDGKRPRGTPEFTGRLFAEWDLPMVKGLTVLGGMDFATSQYQDLSNAKSIPAWVRFDAGLRYAMNIRETDVIVRFNVENLFDNDYWASVDRGNLYIGAPRTFMLSSTFNF